MMIYLSWKEKCMFERKETMWYLRNCPHALVSFLVSIYHSQQFAALPIGWPTYTHFKPAYRDSCSAKNVGSRLVLYHAHRLSARGKYNRPWLCFVLRTRARTITVLLTMSLESSIIRICQILSISSQIAYMMRANRNIILRRDLSTVKITKATNTF